MSGDWKISMIARLAALFIRTLHGTLRMREVGVANIETMNAGGKPYIITFWHSQLLTMIASRCSRPVATFSSTHRDGEIMVQTQRRFGIDAVRGSSTRGATAGLRELIRVAQNGSSLAITPDGPKGPARIVKPGVVFVARASGLPILPAACALKKKSSCARGISCSSPGHSPALSFSTASRSTCLVIWPTTKQRSGASARRTL
jgi:lysophospholipid acyltransferase (LPLAT)-like uncharacterized protein